MAENGDVRHYLYVITSLTLAWSCGLTAIAYFKRYFNKDHKCRKVMNEAIYPFYLLHQPALIFVGYFVLEWNISYGMQAILITIISLVSILITYWFVIRKFNILRVSFGLKVKARKNALLPKRSFVNSGEGQLQPIIVDVTSIKPKRDEII